MRLLRRIPSSPPLRAIAGNLALLRAQSGFSEPSTTWAELRRQAERVQAEEQAAGHTAAHTAVRRGRPAPLAIETGRGEDGGGDDGSGRPDAAPLPGRVTAAELLGREALYHVEVTTEAGPTDVLSTTARQEFAEGDAVRLRLERDRLHVFPRGGHAPPTSDERDGA